MGGGISVTLRLQMLHGHCRLCPETGKDISGHFPSELSLAHAPGDSGLEASQDCWLIGT